MTLRDAFGVVSQSVAGGETIVGVTVCVRFLFTRLYTHFRANAFVEKLLFYSATPTTRTAVSRIRSMCTRALNHVNARLLCHAVCRIPGPRDLRSRAREGSQFKTRDIGHATIRRSIAPCHGTHTSHGNRIQ